MGDNKSNGDGGKLLYCSFCGKSQHEVRKLIAGPSVYVCDECVELCNDIIREEIKEISPKRIRKNYRRLMNCGLTWMTMSLGKGKQKSIVGSGLQPLQTVEERIA